MYFSEKWTYWLFVITGMVNSDSSYWMFTNPAFLTKCGEPQCVLLSVPNVLPHVAADREFYFANRIVRRHIHFMHVLDVQVHNSEIL